MIKEIMGKWLSERGFRNYAASPWIADGFWRRDSIKFWVREDMIILEVWAYIPDYGHRWVSHCCKIRYSDPTLFVRLGGLVSG